MTFKHIIIPVTAFQQNCSLLVCEKTQKAALIDPGGESDRIIAALEQQAATLEKIVLTHGHIDHVGAAAEIAKRFDVVIEGPNQADKYWLDDLNTFAAMMQMPPCESFVPDRWLQQGDKIVFGEIELDVLHCPGHTPGHVVFFHPSSGLAFVGDVLFKGSIGRTDFPGGNHEQLISSIHTKLLPLGDAVKFVPGHGPMSTLGHERQTNPYI